MAIKKFQKILTNDKRFKETPVFLIPHFDEISRSFRVGEEVFEASGQRGERGEYVFEAKVPGSSLVFSNTMEGFPFRHGDGFDPDDRTSQLLLQIGVDEGIIARSRTEFNPSIHRFYIHDEDQEASEVITKADSIAEALQFIGSGNAKDHRDLAAYFGENVTLMSERQINAFVKNMAMTNPSQVISASKSNMFKAQVFLNKLVAHRIITERAGLYFHGSEQNQPLGDKDAVMTFMKNGKNNVIVTAWFEKLRQLGEGDSSMVTEKEETAKPGK